MIVDEPRPLRTRIRWWVAKQLDCRSRRTCWADLVSFALGDRRSPWQPIRPECRRDAAANGYCYCGKVMADGTTRAPGTGLPGGAS